jgi:hypothetical protein
MERRREAPRLAALWVGTLACGSVVWLYRPWLLDPFIRYDDFNFLTRSRTWSEFWQHVWQPMNDHAMPLSRLAAALLMQSATEPSMIPRLAALQGVFAVVLGMCLIYVFVSRELRHALYGLIAMVCWGVSGAYYECVAWYSASFFVLCLDTIMLAMIAAQAWRHSGRLIFAASCVACCALAPGWFAGGVLAGPICALYLLDVPVRRDRLFRAGVPLIGTVLFLSVSLPRTAESIVHAEHYRGKSVFQAFDPVAGAANTLRTLADNQVLGAIGLARPTAMSWPAVWVMNVIWLSLAVVWWNVAPQKRLIVVGFAIILASDLLVYSARADWNYAQQVHRWTRYHLFPHFGLALAFVAGLPAFANRLFTPLPDARLSYRQVAGLVVSIVLLAAIHASTTSGSHIHIAESTELMRQMDRVQAACRSGIASDVARQALGFRQLPVGYRGDNAWELLRCSDHPRPISVEDAAVVLRAAQ